MFESIESTVPVILETEISDERRMKLNRLSDFISAQISKDHKAKLVFICTHNSRRSHLCQVWAQVAAEYYGRAERITTYSGGTEVTAINSRILASLKRSGFQIENPGGDNPRVRIYYSKESEPVICFSKVYDDPLNPSENFAAVMTCTDAEQNCPLVAGSSARISIPYDDPKHSDNSPEEARAYDERSRQIASEMFYVVSRVANN